MADYFNDYDSEPAEAIGPDLGWGHCDLCGFSNIQCVCGVLTCHGSNQPGVPHLNEPNCSNCGRDLRGVRDMIVASSEKLREKGETS